MQPIRVINQQFDLVAEIVQYEALTVPHQLYGTEPLELKINKHMPFADRLQQGHILFVADKVDNAFQIRHKEIMLDANGAASENWLIRAVPLHTWLGSRLCMPPQGHGRHLIEGFTPQQTVAEMVRFNALQPENPNRKIANLIIGEIGGRGFPISVDLRFGNMLEKIQELAQFYEFGVRIRPDIATKQFVLDIYVGDDKTVQQNFRPPVIFSPDFGTLAEIEYVESSLDYKNTAFVAGQGEGLERKFYTVGDEHTGLDRYEVFVDATDVENVRQETKQTVDEDGFVTESILEIPRPIEDIERDLRVKGEEKLAQHTQQLYVNGQVYSSRFRFNEHWRVGDYVTVKHDEWGLQLHTIVTSVVETHQAGQPMTLQVTFGHDIPTFFDKAKRGLNAAVNRQ